jgi:hypothetical protein
MAGSTHFLAGFDLMTGAFALSVFAAGAALAVLAVLGVYAFRRAGQSGTGGLLWRGALVLVGALLAWVLLDRSSIHEFAAERRAIEARAAELTARAIAPGSALACLDAVASAAVETACEKSLFASPEAVAAAVAYVDARFALLGPSLVLAERDPSYRPSVERLRRALEADRFGLVAHVLMTRGCNAADCADLKLLRDSGRILANMMTRTFDIHVRAHAVAWQPGSTAVAAQSPPLPAAATSLPPFGAAIPAPPAGSAGLPPPTVALTPSTPPANATTGAAHTAVPVPSQYDFPSSASIPAVSIMNPEPSAPPAAEPRAAQAQPKRSPTQPARRQSAREPAQPNSPPLSVVPQEPSQTSGAR